jgi:hypothetical protein
LPRFARNSTSPVGGTTIAPSNLPRVAIIGAIVAVVLVIGYFAFRGSKKTAIVDVEPTTVETRPNNVPEPSNPGAFVNTPNQPTQAKAPSPEPVAADLERSLKRARLWATVTVIGDRVDVRSGSCSDPQMRPTLDAVAGSFKAAGVTRLRCLEQSGSVVIDRDL